MADSLNYGSSGEGFSDTLARMRQQSQAADELKAKMNERTRAEDGATDATVRNAGARGETAAQAERLNDVIARSTQLLGLETSAVDADTAAWRANASARRAAGTAGVTATGSAGRSRSSSASVISPSLRENGLNEDALNQAVKEEAAARTQAAAAAVSAARQEALSAGRPNAGQLGAGSEPRVLPQYTDTYGGPARPVSSAPSARSFVAGPTGSAVGAAASGGEFSGIERVAIQNAQALGGLADQQERVNSAFRESVAGYASSSQSLQRNGALTTEFLSAFARGEVTLKEFESQMLQTIGKFGGWAIAGGLVYGAFEAVKQLGEGATASQHGVAELSRFIDLSGGGAADAQQKFRSLSGELNVNISEVVNAVVGMSRVFKNLDDAAEAGKAVILATKLDAINTNEGFQYLTGIAQSYGIKKGSELVGVVNSLNSLQNKYGARVSETLPGVAKAGPAALAAGADINTVEALVGVGVRAGLSGSQVATGIVRSATTFVEKPESQNVLRHYGIDPTGSYKEIIDSIVKVFNTQHLSGAQVRDLAVALGGPQLGGRTFAPILARANLIPGFREAAANPTQTAEEERKKQLTSIQEQAKGIGIGLEGLGSTLESSGILVPVQELLTLVNQIGKSIEFIATPLESIGTIFNSLPGPLREVVALLAVGAATAKGFSHFGDTGVGVLGRVPGLSFLDSDPRKALRQLTATQQANVLETQNEYEGLGRQTRSTAGRARSTLNERERFIGANQDVAALNPATSAEGAAYQAQLAEYNARLASDSARADAAARAYAAKAEELAAEQALLADLKSKELTVQAKLNLAVEEQLYAASLGPPNVGPIYGPTRGAGTAEEAVASAGAARAAGAGAAGGVGVDAAGAVERVTAPALEDVGRFSGGIAAGLTLASQKVGSLATRTEAFSSTAPRAVEGASRALDAAGSGALAFGGRLSLLRGSVGNFIAGLGPLELIAGGLLATYAGLDAVDHILGDPARLSKLNAQGKALEEVPTNAVDLRKQLKESKQSTGGFLNRTLDPLREDVAREIHPLANIEELFGGASHPEYFATEARDKTLKAQKKREEEIKNGTVGYLDDIQKASTTQLESFGSQFAAQVEALTGGDEATTSKAQSAINSTIGHLANVLKLFGNNGPGTNARAELETAVGQFLTQAGKTNDPSLIEAFSQAADTANQALKTETEGQLQFSLAFSTTHSERQAALQAAITAYEQQYQVEIAEPLQKLQEELTNEETQLAALEARQAQEAASGQAAKAAATNKRVEALKSQIGGTKQQLGTVKAQGAQQAQQQKLAEQQAAQNAYSADQQTEGAEGQLAQANAGGNRLDQLKAQLDAAKKQGATAQQDLGSKDPNGAKNAQLQAEAQVKQIQQQIVQEHLSQLRARGQKSEAEVPSQQPVELAQVQLKDAEAQAAYVKAHKKDFSYEEIISAETAVISAKKAVNDAITENARQLAQIQTQISQAEDTGDPVSQAKDAIAGAQKQLGLAQNQQQRLQAQLEIINANNQLQQALQTRIASQAAYAESLTTDPLKQDQIKVSAAAKTLQAAKGPEDKLKAATELNNVKNQYKQDQVSNTESDITFQLEMNQISKEQAIERLNELLKIKDLAKATRQEIQSKIHQLETEGDNNAFDLKPGSIKLPTVADVHRALGAANANAAAIIHAPTDASTSYYAIDVKVANAGDIDRVSDALDRATGSSLRSRTRAAGLRGN